MSEDIKNLVCPVCGTTLKGKRKPGIYRCAVKFKNKECGTFFWLPPYQWNYRKHSAL